MQRSFETLAKRGALIRRLRFGCFSLLFVVVFTAIAETNALSRVSAGAKEVSSLVAWYARSGQWRADASAYMTYAEFLFCPNSDAGDRIELDDDE